MLGGTTSGVAPLEEGAAAESFELPTLLLAEPGTTNGELAMSARGRRIPRAAILFNQPF